MNTAALRDLFNREVGGVESVDVPRSGIAYVKFQTPQLAQQALTQGQSSSNRFLLGGRPIVVQPYDPEGTQKRQVYFAGATYSMTDDEIKKAFEPFGSVVHVRVTRFPPPKLGYGFLTFQRETTVPSPLLVNGHGLTVKPAIKYQKKPFSQNRNSDPFPCEGASPMPPKVDALLQKQNDAPVRCDDHVPPTQPPLQQGPLPIASRLQDASPIAGAPRVAVSAAGPLPTPAGRRTGKSRSPLLARRRDESRSRSPPRRRDKSRSRSPPRRRDKSRSRSPVRRRDESRSRLPPRRRDKSRSRSPPRRRDKSRSRSPVHRRDKRHSRSPPRRRDKSRSRSPVHRRDKRHSRSPPRRRDESRSPSTVPRDLDKHKSAENGGDSCVPKDLIGAMHAFMHRMHVTSLAMQKPFSVPLVLSSNQLASLASMLKPQNDARK